MKILDVNLLLYAVNRSASSHERARRFWEGCLRGEESVGLAWTVLLAFLRLSTRPGLFPRPLSVEEATTKIDVWLSQPPVFIPVPGDRHWSLLQRLIRRVGTAGNLTADAHLAAIAIENDATLCSADDDFRRFGPELRFENPLA